MINFEILVYFYLLEVGSKTKNKFSKFQQIPSVRPEQQTQEVQTHRSLKFLIS